VADDVLEQTLKSRLRDSVSPTTRAMLRSRLRALQSRTQFEDDLDAAIGLESAVAFGPILYDDTPGLKSWGARRRPVSASYVEHIPSERELTYRYNRAVEDWNDMQLQRELGLARSRRLSHERELRQTQVLWVPPVGPADPVPPRDWGSVQDSYYSGLPRTQRGAHGGSAGRLSPPAWESPRMGSTYKLTVPFMYSPRGKREDFWQALGACCDTPSMRVY